MGLEIIHIKDEYFKIGDYVEVTNDGNCYPIFDELLEHFNLKKMYNTKNGDKGIIKHIILHPYFKYNILLIVKNKKTDENFIVGRTGVKKDIIEYRKNKLNYLWQIS
ncbi:MAG: hypothetical protein ACOCP8_08180 [archaeon]